MLRACNSMINKLNPTIKVFLAVVGMALLLTSCASRKKISYFQNLGSLGSSQNSAINYEPKIKQDDLLMIIVSAPTPELSALAAPFNLPAVAVIGSGSESLGGGLRFQSYLVDSQGNINFPVVGTIKLGGLTKSEAVAKLKTEIERYLKNPIINMRINNYKITVLGEVVKPGEYPVVTERVTLPEALAMAGDLTIYGNRKNVLLIREINGVKTSTQIDLTSADVINSEYYYLSQNDFIYVQPNQTRINSSAVGPNITVGISALSLLITIIALVAR